MIEPHLFAAFVLAVTALMLLPGPNVALITANSMTYGVRFGLLTVAGTSAAMVVQLGVTVLGMGAVLAQAGPWFGALRWVGAAYLVVLGVQAWRRPANQGLGGPAPAPGRMFRRAVLVSLTNPKTLFFYGAFLPQFVSPSHAILPQLAVLSGAFLGIALIIDSLWAVTAHQARCWLIRHGAWIDRASGSVLIGAGLSLAFARGK